MVKPIPRVRKQRALAKAKEQQSHEHRRVQDANSVEIIPETKTAREERKARLREEIRAQQPQSKLSKQKQKRLDKYIDKKLKKDESLALIKKLEQTRVDTSLFASSKTLGKTDSKKESLQRALRERDAGVNVDQAEEVLFETRDGGDQDRSVEQLVGDVTQSSMSAASTSAAALSSDIPKAFGSGLKRPLELDDSGRPVIHKRQKTKSRQIIARNISQPTLSEDELEWTGFSEGSATEEENGRSSESDPSVDSDFDSEEGSQEEGSGSAVEDEADSDDDISAESDSENDEGDENASKTRVSAFKSWAEKQRNEAIGFTPSGPVTDNPIILPPEIDYAPLPVEQDPLPEELIAKGRKRKAYAVPVHRSEGIQAVRMALPVVAEEQRIMEAIFNNDVTIISGATGSGKTTQVPQFLFENGFGDPNGPTPGMIGITQPRRVAAVSMANRVGDEMTSVKGRVSYQIRFDTTVGRQTAIKFMTDGVLLRELSDDLTLKKYSVIIIDEAHERTVNTDILISLLSRCVKGRAQLANANPKNFTALKLVIMSATLRVSDFRENPRLFDKPPPLVSVEGRQYGVTPHWQRKTHHDWLEDAFQKIKRGHKKLPNGGMLVFVTGQNEVQTLMKKLKKALPATEPMQGTRVEMRLNASEMPLESEDLESRLSKPEKNGSLENDYSSGSDLDLDGFEGDDEEADEFSIEGEEAANLAKIHVLPLYSQLPSEEQLKVFSLPPEGSRLIVLATNVAETSLTIPGIRYVIDSGRMKQRVWDAAGVESFETTWVSKASADQRAGRAGRTGPGHCYRLFSSAVYETFQDFAEPEIRSAPMERVVLQLKAMNIPNLEKFPFVTAPDQLNWLKAEKLLANLGAVNSTGEITPLGQLLQTYPLNPRFGNMLRLGVEHQCAPHVIATIAAMDAPELFVPETFLRPVAETSVIADMDDAREVPKNDDDAADEAMDTQQRKAYNAAHANFARLDRSADVVKLYTAVYDYSHTTTSQFQYCQEHFLRPKALKESTRLRQQLCAIVSDQNPKAPIKYAPRLSKPSDHQLALLKQIVAAAFIDQLAIRADCLPSPPDEYKKPSKAIDVRYVTLMPSIERSKGDEPYVYIHPSSILSRRSVKSLPRFLVYHRLHRAANARPGKIAKVRMHVLTPVSAEQIAVLARGSQLLGVSKPLSRVTSLQSCIGEERRECEVLLSLEGGEGRIGWPLVKKRVLQRRVVGKGWEIEKYLD